MAKFKENVSEKKQALMDEACAKPLMAGETVYVLGRSIDNIKPEKEVSIKILSIIDEDTFTGVESEYAHQNTKSYILKKSDVLGRLLLMDVGANPFAKFKGRVQVVAYELESILFSFDLLGKRERELYTINGVVIERLNWNPWVINKNGQKEYYQRAFVWNLENKQLLIDSLYNNIDCGKILVRENSWEKVGKLTKAGHTDVGFFDIIDGKQRLYTIHEFVNNKFPDSYGNYFDDLSNRAQRKLTGNQLLGYTILNSDSPDEAVIEQFLKLNFTGIPQSQEHINHVKEIYKKM